MTNEKEYPGVLIVFEGIDGSGKTTLAHNVTDQLRNDGFDAVGISEPTDGHYGKLIRDNAKRGFRFPPEKERELFEKDRRENVEKNILPFLRKREILVMDRYYISTMAYQGARGLNPDEIRKDNESFAPIPDLLIILDIPAREGLRRITEKRKEKTDDFEKESYLEKVRQYFLQITFPNMCILDAQQHEQILLEEAMEEIRKLLV